MSSMTMTDVGDQHNEQLVRLLLLNNWLAVERSWLWDRRMNNTFLFFGLRLTRSHTKTQNWLTWQHQLTFTSHDDVTNRNRLLMAIHQFFRFLVVLISQWSPDQLLVCFENVNLKTWNLKLRSKNVEIKYF